LIFLFFYFIIFFVSKSKLNKIKQKKKRKWASFTNPARGDNFTLNHWVKASEVDEGNKKKTNFLSFFLELPK